MKKIVQREDPVLRKKAEEVPLSDIGSKKIQEIIENMKKALKAEDDGVAIAAPQIGYSLRIFVVSHKVFQAGKPDAIEKDRIYINPIITKTSQEREPMEEGCLSVRWLYGHVVRHKKATVRAYDEAGKEFTQGASGLLAQIFQHEVDHLNGILFIDSATDVKDMA